MKYSRLLKGLFLTAVFVSACSSSEKKVERIPEQPPTSSSAPRRVRGEGMPRITAERYFTEGDDLMESAADIAAFTAAGLVHGSVSVPPVRYPILKFECDAGSGQALDVSTPLAFYEGTLKVQYEPKRSGHSFEATEKFTANEKGGYAITSKKDSYRVKSADLLIGSKAFHVERDYSYTVIFPKCQRE